MITPSALEELNHYIDEHEPVKSFHHRTSDHKHDCETCRFWKASNMRPEFDLCSHPKAVAAEQCFTQRLLSMMAPAYCSKEGLWWEPIIQTTNTESI